MIMIMTTMMSEMIKVTIMTTVMNIIIMIVIGKEEEDGDGDVNYSFLTFLK